MEDKWNTVVYIICKYYFIGMILLTILLATKDLTFAFRFLLIQFTALMTICVFLGYSEISIGFILIKLFFLFGIIFHVIPIALPLWIDIPRYVVSNTTVEKNVVIDYVNVGFGFDSAYVDGKRYMILGFDDKYPEETIVTIVYLPYSNVIVDAKQYP